MFYTIAQVSELTNLSKVSIYNKLKLKELQAHTFKKQGITYIDEEGLNLIKDSLKFKEQVKTDLKEENKKNLTDEELSATGDNNLNLKSDFINHLKGTIEVLEQQLDVKDKQIEGLTLGLHQAQALTNNQQQGQQSVLLLEEHLKEFDVKLNGLKEQIQDNENKKNNKRGLLKKLFKK